MVGDSEDGDLVPARKFGWRTWLLTPDGAGEQRPGTGGWMALARSLGLQIASR